MVVLSVSASEEYRFLRPMERDTTFEQLVPLLHRVGARNLVRLFAHLLHERRVIFCAASLQVLSTGVQSTLALLYPFVWQHVLVPVLPEALLNFCCAPMPFVTGVLSQQLAELRQLRDAMEDVVIFDLDNDAFLDDDRPGAAAGDLASIPDAYRTAIVHQVDAAKRGEKNGSVKQGKMLARPFLAFFVQMFWNYKRFFSVAGGFDKEEFLASKSSPASRSFLADFVDTQMACQFFEELRAGGAVAARLAAFDRLTTFVDMQFQAAVRELEQANPRERFKRRMSKILPFGAVRKSSNDLRTATGGGSSTSVLQPEPLSPSKQFAREQNRDNLEIVKKRDQVSSFGLPLSTMSRKAQPPAVLVAAASASLSPPRRQADDMSPFKIRGQIEPGHSPNIFSPSREDDDPGTEEEEEEEELMRSIGHAERFLSKFFEASAIERGNDTTSFASADDSDAPEKTLEEDMVALARLIQESWAEFGDDVQPTVLSPSSPYHDSVSYERYGLVL